MNCVDIDAEPLSTGYSWTECPRWHDRRFTFTDLYNKRIVRLGPGGNAETVVDLDDRATVGEVPGLPLGNDFLPDGRLVINSMYERRALVWDGEAISEYADLSDLAPGPINDLIVDAAGRSYVSQLGFDYLSGEEARDSPVMAIEPDGATHTATEDLAGPNGMAISDDGTTMYVAEAFSETISAFDIGPSGELVNRRQFATYPVDGICADEAGGVWTGVGEYVAHFTSDGVIDTRVRVDVDRAGSAIACVLGGGDRRTLYICCGFDVMDADKSKNEGKGSIWTARVPTAGGRARP